jgi:hypothetical protein
LSRGNEREEVVGVCGSCQRTATAQRSTLDKVSSLLQSIQYFAVAPFECFVTPVSVSFRNLGLLDATPRRLV